MKRLIVFCLLTLAALPLALRAEEALAAANPLKLTGLMGIGLDSMPGLAPQQVPIFSNLVKTPDTVVFRYWLNENFSWEGQLALSYSSVPSATTQTTSTRAWGLGTAFKWNFKRPTETSLAQLLVGLDVAGFGQGPDTSGTTQNTTTLSLYVGPGFEYFIPSWRSLSVEGSLRLRIASSSSKTDPGSAAAQSSTSIDVSGNGFSPLNLSLHYYF